jgi:hypothetical protein
MNNLKICFLLVISLWINDAIAVDLSGITVDDLMLFYNYLLETAPIIAGSLIIPLALYYGGMFIVSSVYSMFRT